MYILFSVCEPRCIVFAFCELRCIHCLPSVSSNVYILCLLSESRDVCIAFGGVCEMSYEDVDGCKTVGGADVSELCSVSSSSP